MKFLSDVCTTALVGSHKPEPTSGVPNSLLIKETSALSKETWIHHHLTFNLSHPVWCPLFLTTDVYYSYLLKTRKNKQQFHYHIHLLSVDTLLNHFCLCEDWRLDFFFSSIRCFSFQQLNLHLLNFVVTDPYSRYSLSAPAQHHCTDFRWACN